MIRYDPILVNLTSQGLFQQFWEKAPCQNWEKMIDLTSKLGEINDIEHYKGSKIYSKSSYYTPGTKYIGGI